MNKIEAQIMGMDLDHDTNTVVVRVQWVSGSTGSIYTSEVILTRG